MGEINESMPTLGATDDFMIKQEQISSYLIMSIILHIITTN